MPVPIIFAGALVASISRCNELVATQLQGQLSSYSSKPVTAGPDLDQRLGDLAYVIQQVDAEYDIVSNVCPNVNDLAPVESALNADLAWALEQQADVSRRRALEQCPASADAVGAGFLAAGWRRLVLATPDADHKPSPQVTKLTALFQQQAPVYQLTLPAGTEASDYWVKTVQDKGNAAVQACPTPKQ
jgi:hypothetical protein